MKFIEKVDGHVFATGDVFRRESSMLVSTLLAYVRLHDRYANCAEVDNYVEKFKEVYNGDFIVMIDDSSFLGTSKARLYFPQKNRKQYLKKKKEYIEQLRRTGKPVGNCITAQQYDALISG